MNVLSLTLILLLVALVSFVLGALTFKLILKNDKKEEEIKELKKVVEELKDGSTRNL